MAESVTYHNSVSELNKETCGCDVAFRKPKRISWRWTQRFATAKWALVFFSVGSMMQQLVINGLLSVVISTLEKRFELQSTESGLIASCFGAAAFVTTVFVTLKDDRAHKTKWYSFGTFVCGIGAFAFALPHFFAPVYTFVEPNEQNFCNNVTEKECAASSLRNFRFLFMGAICLLGVGSCFQHAFGITYLDENVSKDNSAFYNSIYFAVTGLGPAIGFVCGGASLELYTYISSDDGDNPVDSSSDLWIGAWWISFIISGVITMAMAVPLMMFPRHLPGTAKFRENRDVEMQKMSSAQPDDNRFSAGNFSNVVALVRNKPYVFITLGSAVNCAFIFGFNTFGAKYLESVFGLIPFQASLIYGAAAILSSVFGHLVSGYFVKRMSLGVRGIAKFTVVSGIFSAICSLGFLLHCEDVDIAGGTVPYPNSTTAQSAFSECNSECGCSTDLFEPACHNKTMYFSPCFAGCTKKISDTAYASCSCLPNLASSQETIVSLEACNRNACSLIYPFIFIVFLCFFSSILTISPSYQITLRCVHFKNRILAISIQRMVVLSLGVVPGRILSGIVMDRACVAWSTECGEQGSCRAYKRWELARNNTILLISQTTVCAVLYLLTYLTYDPVQSDNDIHAVSGVKVQETQTEENYFFNQEHTVDENSVELTALESLMPTSEFISSNRLEITN